MGSCNSGEHIAENIRTDITTCNTEEPNRSTFLERSVGGGRLKQVSLDPKPRP